MSYPTAPPYTTTRIPDSKIPAEVVTHIMRGEVEALDKWFDGAGKGVHPDDLCADGWTLLGHAAHGGENDAIHALIKRGADINKKDLHGVSPIAACAASPECLRKTADLMLHGMDVDGRRLAKPWAEVDSRVWCVLRQRRFIA